MEALLEKDSWLFGEYVQMTETIVPEDDSEKCPPWINREDVFQDVAAVMVKYSLTVGQFYDALGVNVYENIFEDVIDSCNRMADLRRELTLEADKK